MNDYFHRVVKRTPTRFWINNVTREQAQMAINGGATGCTQNPSYPYKMMIHPSESGYVQTRLLEILKREADDRLVLIALQRELIGEIAAIFLPQYQASGGRHGFVSIQGDPFMEDAESMIRFARYNREAGENIMAKIPATKDGLQAIAVLIKEGVPINATEIMAVKQAVDVTEIYRDAIRGMSNPPPIYLSHIAGIYDEYLKMQAARENIDISDDALWHAGISIAKKAYHMVNAILPGIGFIGGGARELHHFTEMVGSASCITINWEGTADRLIEQNPPVVSRFLRPTPPEIIDELCEKMPDYRKGYFLNGITDDDYESFGPVVLFRESFEKAWTNALRHIAKLREERT